MSNLYEIILQNLICARTEYIADIKETFCGIARLLTEIFDVVIDITDSDSRLHLSQAETTHVYA